MTRRVVIAGGTGLLGRSLARSWSAEGADVVVLSRSARASREPGVRLVSWDGRSQGAWAAEIDASDLVVNLAGENVGEGRWTPARKRLLRTSRLDPSRALTRAVQEARRPPRALLQASAIGIYGDRGEERIEEGAAPGEGFLPRLCVEWEDATREVESIGVRRVLLRTGIVLAREGGALPRMRTPFAWGVGGRLGSGRQWFSWVHLEDAVAAIRFLAERSELSGAVHLTAPEPVRNLELTRALGRALRRPALLPVPARVLQLLFGEMAQVLLGGQRVLPARLAAAGFSFRFPGLEGALRDLVGRPA